MTKEIQLPQTIAEFSEKRRKAFTAWIERNGGEVHLPHDWELLRIITCDGVSILYYNAKEHLTWTGELPVYYRAYRRSVGMRLAETEPRMRGRGGKRSRAKQRRMRTLRKRDGGQCFFCGQEFTKDLRPTLEELCPRTAGGPVHIANQTLACDKCNQEAGNLSVAEKVRLRDKKRGFV